MSRRFRSVIVTGAAVLAHVRGGSEDSASVRRSTARSSPRCSLAASSLRSALAKAHGAFALAKHAPRTGARVLDIGCGFGESTRDLGRLVGRAGSVVGLDCDGAVLAVATAEARAAGKSAGNVSFLRGDAQVYPFDGSFDLAFARFGTMVFRSPRAALRNIRSALRPSGRVLCITWRGLALNPWAAIPKEIVLRHLPLPPDGPYGSSGPGTFSMADPEVVRSLLEGTGFTSVTLEATDAPIVIGADLDEAVELQLALGPAAEIVREAGELGRQRRGAIVRDLRAALSAYETPRGVVMESSSWAVTAANGAGTS